MASFGIGQQKTLPTVRWAGLGKIVGWFGQLDPSCPGRFLKLRRLTRNERTCAQCATGMLAGSAVASQGIVITSIIAQGIL
jgi:hypothetical protein